MNLPLRSRSAHVVAWTVLLLAMFAGLGYWWRLGRPGMLAAAPAQRIACVSYTPFRHPGQTPFDPDERVSAAQIDRDLGILSKRFACVRTYGQAMGLDQVPAIARRHHMTVLLGIWLARDPKANGQEIRQGIATANANRDGVRGIVVGNEALLRGELSVSTLVTDLHHVRKATGLPVTYADVWPNWLRYAHTDRLLDAVSFVTIHVLPYWEDAPMPVGRAVAHASAVYAQVQRAIGNKPLLIGETGWPSAGRPRWGAVPSRVNEARYIRQFLAWAQTHHADYNLIESFDQPWKRVQEGTVGGYWGLYDTHAKPKFAFSGPVVESTQWWLGSLAAALTALLFVIAAAIRFGRRPRTWLAMGLAGAATGTAVAAQVRLMMHACTDAWQWSVSGAALVTALATALWLGWVIADALRVDPPAGLVENETASTAWLTGDRITRDLRLLWLAGAALYDLLLVFDGRYRDFPVAVFAPAAIGFVLVPLCRAQVEARPVVEERVLASWLPLAALLVLVQEHAANAEVISWAVVNLLLAWPLWWSDGSHRARLRPGQAQHAHQ